MRSIGTSPGAAPSPEDLAFGGWPIPGEPVRVVAVEHSPDGQLAVVFAEYNEPPNAVPWELLCGRTGDGWQIRGAWCVGGPRTATAAGTKLFASWAWTHDDPDHGPVGVTTRWDPPTALWATEPPRP